MKLSICRLYLRSRDTGYRVNTRSDSRYQTGHSEEDKRYQERVFHQILGFIIYETADQ